jgi:hypothetical protein
VITDAMGRGMLIFTAERPEGPWSDGTVIPGIHGIDPDLAWGPDGTAYITYSGLDTTSGRPRSERRHEGILQITVDLKTGQPLTSPEPLWSGTGLKFPEAPHLYAHGDHWYLVIAEGGTERGHGISIARGPEPSGPFEGAPTNPRVSARSTSRPIQNTGHGDLVETPDGGWAVIMLGMRPKGATQAFSALGRETFITPARWTDGWLDIDPVLLNPRPGDTTMVDDFSGDRLGPEWIAVRRYPKDLATVNAGTLQLTGEGSTLDDLRPFYVAVRQRNEAAEVSVTVDASGGVGGISVRFDERHHYDIEARPGVITARAVIATIRQEWSLPAPDGPVRLHLDCVPATGSLLIDLLTSDHVVLGYTDPTTGVRTDLARVDGRYLSQETAASFTGRVIGLYAVSGEVAFTSFRYSGREPE